ncbi:MAG: chloride channel protein [Bacteriovorax sp.]|nr:chloride channel protein [Bacteriovorax sp.]
MPKILFKWTLLSILVGVMAGTASYAFLISVNAAIEYRRAHQWIVLFLPIAGVLVAWFYSRFGVDVDGGNNLILDEIHDPKKHIPLRMAPMIFASAVISHFFGASVGREGAAVQMSAGLSDQFSKYFGGYFNNRKIILMMGMSAGFASIFGTPIAGTIFGMEILFLGSVTYEALFPCLVASIIGYFTAMTLGISYAHYGPIEIPSLSLVRILSAAAAGICFGLVARFFIWLLHFVKDFLAKKCPNPIYRPFFGGVIVILFFYIFGTDRYQSLGEEIINASFIKHILPWDFIGKIFMTTMSVGSGFRGGEVMSLFYIGATLGNALSFILPLSIPLLAALGFVSVFAGASNTPIACIFLALKLFGSEIGVYAGIAIVVSYLFSGQKSIYHSQRKYLSKKL